MNAVLQEKSLNVHTHAHARDSQAQQEVSIARLLTTL